MEMMLWSRAVKINRARGKLLGGSSEYESRTQAEIAP